MKKAGFILGIILTSAIITSLFKIFILDNVWLGGLIMGITNAYGFFLYNKKFTPRPD